MATLTNIGSRDRGRGAPRGRPRRGPQQGGHKGRPYRILAALVLTLLAAGGVRAQQQSNDQPARVEVWDLKLGTPADRLPGDFTDYACGTNGGPPSIPLNGGRDFPPCRPHPEGLPQAYSRYHPRLDSWSKANTL